MIPWSLIANLVGGTFSKYVTKKGEIAEKKAVARIENVSKGISGYSDEYLVLIWSYPVIASFVPSLQPSVEQGMNYLTTLPEWYIGGFMAISFAVFGIDKIFKFKK
tara:strand:- start:435 stop:752 length:318 start_codon:yes stop_codon:yes gene_type:complete